jgi:microcystin-dependent protein
MKRKLKFLAAGLAAFLAVTAASAYVDFFIIPNANILFGKNNSADKTIYFNNNLGIPGNPVIRMHAGQLQFSNDGVTFQPFSAGIPSGVITEWAQDIAPQGWIFTDGTAYSRTSPTYAALFASIGTKYGIGDGSTTFNVPDLRGLMTRVPDDNAGLDGEISGRTNYAAGSFNTTFLVTANTQGTNVLQIPALIDCENLASGQLISGAPDIPVESFIIATNCTGAGPYSATMSTMATGSNAGETLNVTNGAGGGAGSQFYSGSYSTYYSAQHTHPENAWLNVGGGFTLSVIGSASTFGVYTTTGGMNSGNPSGEVVPQNIYMWKIIKL